jgi:hypothetical protein
VNSRDTAQSENAAFMRRMRHFARLLGYHVHEVPLDMGASFGSWHRMARLGQGRVGGVIGDPRCGHLPRRPWVRESDVIEIDVGSDARTE